MNQYYTITLNASTEDIERFLRTPGKIAIIGASTKPDKAGHFVPKYLRRIGFETLLINPIVDEISGIPTYKNLDSINIDDLKGIVIYRKLPIAEEIAMKAINLGIPVVWLPDRITSDKAKKMAHRAKIMFVQDDCILRRGNKLKILA